MRILLWQEPFWPLTGGIQTQSEWLVPASRARGHEIIIVTRQDTPGMRRIDCWHGCAVYRLPFWQALDSRTPRAVLAVQREIGQLCGDFKPDVIHLNGFGPTALFALRTKRAHQTPLL